MTLTDSKRLLQDAIIKLAKPKRPEKGNLGYVVNNSEYAIRNPDRPSEFYVRIESIGVVSVPHKGRVMPIPDLAVSIEKNGDGKRFISGLWQDNIDNLNIGYQDSYQIGLHGHERFSGLEYPIDLRLLEHVKVKTSSGLILTASQGYYQHNGYSYFWNGLDTIDLTSYRPITENQHSWIIVGIDTGDSLHVLRAYAGSSKSTASDLNSSELLELKRSTLKDSDFIPLCGVKLANGQSIIVESNYVSLMQPITGSRDLSGLSASNIQGMIVPDDCQKINYSSLTVRSFIELTGENSQVVVL